MLDGDWDPAGPPKHPRRKKKKVFPRNDGRPPDTIQLLQDDGHLVSAVNKQLVSYQWNRVNSCYVDHTVEIWFRHWNDWHPNEQEFLLSMLDKKSFLAFLLNHFSMRGRLINDGGESTTKGGMEALIAELKRGQLEILRYCEQVWGLANHKGEYLCATAWLQNAVRVSANHFC